MKTYRLIRSLIAWAILIIGFSSSGAIAQPTNYCNPMNWPGMGYYYCYPSYLKSLGYDSYYNATIKRVKIWNADETKLDVSSADYLLNCYEPPQPGVEAEVMLGTTYKFDITTRLHSYGYGGSIYCYTTYYTMRIFIDWNMDGDFADPGEWVNDPTGPNAIPSWRVMAAACQDWNYSYNITIPDNQPIGKTRMRVCASYYYPYAPYYPPTNACHNGYWDTYGNPTYYAYDYGETEDYILSFALSVKNTFPDSKAPRDILYAGQIYDGTTRQVTIAGATFNNFFDRPWVEFGSPQVAGTKMTYKIQGPLPSTDVIYEGIDPVTGSTQIEVGNQPAKITLTKSQGSASPAGNGTFIQNSGGEYRLTVGVALPNKPFKEVVKNFTVSWPYDISVLGVTSPRSNGAPDFMMYPRGLDMAVSGTLQNTGLFPVTRFDTYAYVLNSKDQVVATFYYKFDTTKGKDQPLLPKQKIEKQYGTFNTTVPDEYRVYITTELMNAEDFEPYNNRYPRSTGYYTFQVQDEIQAAADAMLKPAEGERMVAGRPFIPKGDFINKGVGDISNANAKFVYWKLPNGKKDSVKTLVKDLPSGRYNRKSEKFPTIQIDEPGDYEGWLYIEATDDIVTEDNKKKINFTVIPGLVGTYTVGTQNAGASRNFPTIDSAMRALYYYGVQGSVTMELTDADYLMETNTQDYPAWDMTSTILGLGYDKKTDSYNTLTWRPSPVRAVTRGGVTIRLSSPSGRGIQFGQSSRNLNPYA
ncbi:MAG: GEVED domain-containing protein, partial [Chloroflexota bacterium]